MPTNENDIAYDNGIGLMKEINEQIKIMRDTSKWPLAFLVAIAAALISAMFSIESTEKVIYIAIAFSICSFMTFAILFLITIPDDLIFTHSEPKNLIKGASEVEGLQGKIDINKKVFKNLKSRLIISILFTLISVTFFVWFFALV